MMAKDGTRHHSASRARLHDEMMESTGTPKVKAMDKPKAEGESEMSPHSIEEHVSKHGPAHSMEYTHDKASGEHHVTSKHGDQNAEHHSKHKSHKEAHDHMAKAMGVDHEAGEEDDAYEGNETPEEEMAEATGDGGRIPGLS